VRERTVLESHTCEFLAPLWARGGQVAPRALRRDAGESWTAKLSRTAVALAHAGVSKADHDGA
jgi:hypothetical protein